MVIIKRFDVFLISLDPTQGCEINKMRPCVIISPNEMNQFLHTVIVAPMTTKGKNYPTRISVNFSGKEGMIVIDQIRTIDKSRLVKKLGTITKEEAVNLTSSLLTMFAY